MAVSRSLLSIGWTPTKQEYKYNTKSMGPYILGRVLGKGATGTVRLATHETTGRKVALKIIHKKTLNSFSDFEGLDPWTALRREIELMKMLDHPNIVKLYDVFETPKSVVLATEYVKRGELFDHIPCDGLPRKEALRIFTQIVQALLHCHAAGVVHRDLKPENILLDEHNDVKLCDFGMARHVEPGTLLNTSCGSPHYVSPDVIQTGYDGKKADVWSLGVVLYAMLTGSLPFDNANIPALLRLIQTGKYRIPLSVDRDLRDLISKMLQVDPEKRLHLEEVLHHSAIKPPESPAKLSPMKSQTELTTTTTPKGGFLNNLFGFFLQNKRPTPTPTPTPTPPPPPPPLSPPRATPTSMATTETPSTDSTSKGSRSRDLSIITNSKDLTSLTSPVATSTAATHASTTPVATYDAPFPDHIESSTSSSSAAPASSSSSSIVCASSSSEEISSSARDDEYSSEEEEDVDESTPPLDDLDDTIIQDLYRTSETEGLGLGTEDEIRKALLDVSQGTAARALYNYLQTQRTHRREQLQQLMTMSTSLSKRGTDYPAVPDFSPPPPPLVPKTFPSPPKFSRRLFSPAHTPSRGTGGSFSSKVEPRSSLLDSSGVRKRNTSPSSSSFSGSSSSHASRSLFARSPSTSSPSASPDSLVSAGSANSTKSAPAISSPTSSASYSKSASFSNTISSSSSSSTCSSSSSYFSSSFSSSYSSSCSSSSFSSSFSSSSSYSSSSSTSTSSTSSSSSDSTTSTLPFFRRRRDNWADLALLGMAFNPVYLLCLILFE